jgi:hypothetical protein
MLNIATYSMTSQILEHVLTTMSGLPPVPNLLYHYTSLETIQKVLETDDIRLSHAEYSNDQRELEEARILITSRLAAHAGPRTFVDAVEAAYALQAQNLDVYVFCMSTGIPGKPLPQDMLSQWRAYAQDGRGGCLTIISNALRAFVFHFPAGLRHNPVIYDSLVQATLIDGILTAGSSLHAANPATAVDATVGALIFTMPIIKHSGFEEEQEWRLIYTPLEEAPPRLGFHPRRDFLAPFVTLQHLWSDVRTKLSTVPGLPINPPPSNVPVPTDNPLFPVQSVMVGPSGNQSLNERAMRKVITQWRPNLTLQRSSTPYRSVN